MPNIEIDVPTSAALRDAMRSRLAEVEQQRDDLLAACKLAADRLTRLEAEDAETLGWSPATLAVRAAIAKAESI